MSRGVRDLRDLICVSRLTIRDSDDEIPISDDDTDGRVSRFFDDLSLSSGSFSRQSSAHSLKDQRDFRSPDSGIGTNGKEHSPDGATVPKPPAEPRPSSSKKRKCKKKKAGVGQGKVLETVPDWHEFPKSEPLPPVQSAQSRPTSSSSESASSKPEIMQTTPVASLSQYEGPRQGNFDELLTYLDATIVAEWLQTANANVTDLAIWCNTASNFVDFAHFWLSDFQELQKIDIFKLEHSILLDHLQVAFAAGRDCGKVRHRDLTAFLEAVFREYPSRLMSSKGSHMFLDNLDVLSSERHSAYKRLLSDVKCSTRIKQYAQMILAIRSFSLVSVWCAVVNFYRRLLSGPPASQSQDDPVTLASIAKSRPHHLRMYQSIRQGYLDVVHYLLSTGKVRVNDLDPHNKSLVHFAVVHNQRRILHYLLSNVKPPPDVNQAADSGNTPLHAAANTGNVEVVAMLVKAPGIQINPANSHCDNATPLHLAVMHGHTPVVRELLKAGADPHACMGDLSAVDIAQDFDHSDILDLLKPT